MKRSILTTVAAVIAFCAMAAPASAHIVTVAQGGVTCTGVTASWIKFPGGPFDLTATFHDQANGKPVASPYQVAHTSGATGTLMIPAPAASGVTYRSVTITWTVDGGGSVTASAVVKCCPPPVTTTPKPPVTTPKPPVTTPTPPPTTPTKTVTVTVTSTVPGPTTTVTQTVPGPTTTVTTPAVTTPGPTTTVTAPGLTTTVTTPGVTTSGATRTIIRYRTKIKTKTKIVYRPLPVNLKCLPGEVGWSIYPINMANQLIPGKPILAGCKKLPKRAVKDTGVTG